jgi:hypothetical protein
VTTAINKPKRMWDLINKELGNKNFIKDNTEINNGLNLITNPQLIADKFNSHFIDIITELKCRTNSSKSVLGSCKYKPNSFSLVPVTDYEVKNMIKNLKSLIRWDMIKCRR